MLILAGVKVLVYIGILAWKPNASGCGSSTQIIPDPSHWVNHKGLGDPKTHWEKTQWWKGTSILRHSQSDFNLCSLFIAHYNIIYHIPILGTVLYNSVYIALAPAIGQRFLHPWISLGAGDCECSQHVKELVWPQ